MTAKKMLTAVLVIVVVLVGMNGFFTVEEGESALVLRLGKMVSSTKTASPRIYKPGLHVKIPFVDQVRLFDTRMQQLTTSALKPLTVVTKEQTYLVVEYFAKWRIENLAKFYTSMGGSVSRAADTVLEPRINDIVRTEYGKRTSDQAISTDRANMMAAIKAQANHIGKEQGIVVLDVQIQQITLPKDVMDSVFKRMETERKQFAEAKRAEGMEKSEEVRALADQKVTVIRAEAIKQAATVRAQGDKQAAEMYAHSYGADPRFYAFYRSMEAYVKSFSNKRDVLVLKPEGQFFNYFHTDSQTNAVAKK